MSPGRRWAGLLGWLALSALAAGMGSYLTSLGMPDWYMGLEQPEWSPPDAVFGPVWTILFILMAVAAWIVWARAGWSKARLALSLYLLQLTLNVGWSAAFFGLRSPALGLIEIILLWLAILATIVAFLRHHRVAPLLLLPYIGWVTFAAALNFAIWELNA